MKNYLRTVYAAVMCLTLLSAGALTAGDIPTIGSPSDKLFGSNVAYSATREVQTGKAKPIVARVFVDQGKFRHEMEMAASSGMQFPAEIANQMRNSGMSKYILLYLPEKQGFYQIQPGTRGYLELPFAKGKTLTASDYKVETTRLGKETVEGQECVKNRAVVLDPQNRRREFLVWNATGLNNFPVKIQARTSLGESETTLYRDIKLAKPDSKLFELPAGYRKYADMGAMVQDVMMKRMGM